MGSALLTSEGETLLIFVNSLNKCFDNVNYMKIKQLQFLPMHIKLSLFSLTGCLCVNMSYAAVISAFMIESLSKLKIYWSVCS